MANAVRTFTKVIQVTPTISTGIYAAGDSVGADVELEGAALKGHGSGAIQSVVIIDKDAEEAELVVQFYSAAITATDNAALAPTDTEAETYLGEVTVSSYTTLGSNSVAVEKNIGIPFELADDNTSIYLVMMASGTPTYTAATDLVVKVGIYQD